jgi:hypothetical protein
MKKERFLFDQIFKDKIPKVEDLPSQDSLRRRSELITVMFDAGVDTLRNKDTFPNREVNDLMILFWQLVGNKVTPAAVMTGLESMSFWGEIKGVESIAFVLVSERFPELCVEDASMQLGALVFNASKARDYYNGKLANFEEVQKRALAYEAEYLLTLRGHWPKSFTPNEYQSQILATYPNGLASLPRELLYQSLPFVPGVR